MILEIFEGFDKGDILIVRKSSVLGFINDDSNNTNANILSIVDSATNKE